MIAHNHADDIDTRLDQLLQRWEELQQQGESRSPEELCSTCPELAGELARRIALLRAFDPLLTDTDDRVPQATPGPGPAGGPSRESATARADYRDLRFHAAGGLGEVFLARNAELNREVALEVPQARPCPRPREPPPLPPGGRGHRPAGASGRRADLRAGDRLRRSPLLRHAVHPGRDPPGRHRRLPRRRDGPAATAPSARSPCASC